MIRTRIIAISANLLMTAFFGQSIAVTADTAQSANNACDRKCLSGFVTKYLDAMVAHRPGDVPVAANAQPIRRLREALEGGDAVFTTGLILQELLQGFSAPKSRAKILAAFASLPFVISERKDHIDAATLKIRLRQRGLRAGTIDVLLAQLCLRHQLCILTLDRDFDHMARFIPLAIVQ